MACELWGLTRDILYELSGLDGLLNNLVVNEEQQYNYSIRGRMKWAFTPSVGRPMGIMNNMGSVFKFVQQRTIFVLVC